MAQHHALRAPCRAAGIENASKVVAAAHGVRDWRRASIMLRSRPRRTAPSVIGIHQSHAFQTLGDPGAHFSECIVNRQYSRAAITQRILDLSRSTAY